ncbi:glutathione ABC transporter substrate-binding protein [Lysinibacillus piscis]|uniref:Glutathione ABC transporter substrate-binding protein n=1 Tax=Lysinibacillus piscis TaxID=2518931 RepID=A0ABQ5NJ84_9BACI|nr:glutathione ABC transporter substrate-binding protein [Lysinibacillus sp. KH24]GLC88173.1 glutathione ABC transporter substrate-binding protein [Lysinibacillus sp. KH24]
MKKMLLFFALVAVLVLQACSTANNKSEEGAKEGTKSVGGELVILRASDATSLDPHFITDIPSANIIHGKVYETLVAFDRDRKIVPLLAKSWEQTDELTWTFTLNEGIKFHDGTDFNAEAVKATFNRILDPATGSPQRDKLSMISEVIVGDDYTVTLKLKEPYAPLLSILASNEGSIMSPKVIAESADQLATHPVGTGPFVFDSWKSGQEIKLNTNKDYWGNVPKIDKVTFKIVPEDSTRLAMIESGEAHIADQVPVTDIERIENSSTMNLFRTEGLAVEFIGFNVQDSLLSDVKVRQAISYAVDREAIISGIYNNVGTLANSAMSPKVIGYSSETKAYDYDVVKAKELLKEAGIKEGTKVKLLTSDRKERINMAEVIQSQLKGIGLDVDIQVMEYGAFISEITKEQHQLFISGWGNATGDADYNQYNLFHTASMGAPGNHFYYSNPEVDALIEKGRSTSDQTARNDIYKQAMQKELDDAVYIPVRNYEHLAVYSNNVKGFWLDASNYAMISGVEIVE